MENMRAERGDRVKMASRAVKFLLCLLTGAGAMGIGAAQQTAPVVKVDSGQLQGVVDDAVVSYKGIPFAAPPVGDLRWSPPQPAAPWTGVRQATEFGADCMQGRFGPPPPPAAPAAPAASPAPRVPPVPAATPAQAPSENCLFVNVWRPASAAPGAKLPVMFWIYGGGFVGGSSALPRRRISAR
jgi:para-nitrobenzyl esterase